MSTGTAIFFSVHREEMKAQRCMKQTTKRKVCGSREYLPQLQALIQFPFVIAYKACNLSSWNALNLYNGFLIFSVSLLVLNFGYLLNSWGVELQSKLKEVGKKKRKGEKGGREAEVEREVRKERRRERRKDIYKILRAQVYVRMAELTVNLP